MSKRPNIEEFGPLRGKTGVMLGLASAAFLDRYAASLSPLELTPSRVVALACVSASPGLEQKALATRLAITEVSAMATINRLEALGYVERRCGRDKRSKAVFLTVSGVEALDRAIEIEAGIAIKLWDFEGKISEANFRDLLEAIFNAAYAQDEATQ